MNRGEKPRPLAWPVLIGILGVLSLAAGDDAKPLVIEAGKALEKTAGSPVAGGWNLWNNGRVSQPVRFVSSGRHAVVVRAWGSPAGGIWPAMVLLVDGLPVKTVTVNRTQPGDDRFELTIEKGTHEIAVAFLNDALMGNEDRNLYVARITIVPPSDGDTPQLSPGTELRFEADRREQAILAATGPAIETNRKTDAVVRVVDATGKSLAGARVSVVQTGHEFLFGCNIFGFDASRSKSLDALYKQRFAEMFNYATTGFYWASYEPRRGQPNYEQTDKVVAWCVERGIRLKGHPLLWGDRAGIPRWSQGQPSPELRRQRVTDILTRYHGKIGFWEVVNEPSHQPEPTIDEPYHWARQADPSADLIVNDYMVLADGAPQFFHLLEKAKHDGVPFDGIGIQAHEPRTERFPLDRVQAIFDHYATLGKELHITEFTPASDGAPIAGFHRSSVWDEAAQADYAVKFYRVAFAYPSVRAITWWDLSDRYSWRHGGGLLRGDMSPKPSYEQLKHLIHEEWWTSLSGKTDTSGRYPFRGFRGTYRVTVEVDGTTRTTAFELTRGGSSELVVPVR